MQGMQTSRIEAEENSKLDKFGRGDATAAHATCLVEYPLLAAHDALCAALAWRERTAHAWRERNSLATASHDGLHVCGRSMLLRLQIEEHERVRRDAVHWIGRDLEAVEDEIEA
eukprot:3121939-Prymnesium_polylepis.1